MRISGSGARSRCRYAVTAHRVAAIIAGTAALFCVALALAQLNSHATLTQKVALGPAAFAIAGTLYVAFALTAIGGPPSWLLVAVADTAVFASLAVVHYDTLVAPGMLAVAFLFSVRNEKTAALVAVGAMIGVLLVCAAPFGGPEQSSWSILAMMPWIALAGAVGQAVRSKRAHHALLLERVRRAEQGKEAEASRRVQQERLRIARDLHDSVGHHVALISVQAGAMSYLLETDPRKARESLDHIQQASEDALEELRLSVGLLRQPGDSEPLEPAGGLARLGELIESFTSTGLRVSCEVTGQARPLPDAVDLTAYRIIRESLTNTAKHAAGAPAWVRLAYRADVLRVTVEDDGPGSAEATAGTEGHGIIGMRERAAAVGGWLATTARTGGGFRVRAELPAPGRPRGDAAAVPA